MSILKKFIEPVVLSALGFVILSIGVVLGFFGMPYSNQFMLYGAIGMIAGSIPFLWKKFF